jgi:precorrin-6B methylase 2
MRKRLIHQEGANPPYLIVEEYKDVYVSDYSKLLIKNLPFILSDKIICDFGSGTGIIGLCSRAKEAEKVIAIEINSRYRELTKKNIDSNLDPKSFELYASSEDFQKKNNCMFDYIFCNPASLPSIVGDDSFYDGGEFGLNMILEVVKFSCTNLKKDGHLIILITSIIPTSIFHTELFGLNMKSSILDSMDLKFRDHYKNIKDWVDDNQARYPEMLYYAINGLLYERVVVYDVQKK